MESHGLKIGRFIATRPDLDEYIEAHIEEHRSYLIDETAFERSLKDLYGGYIEMGNIEVSDIDRSAFDRMAGAEAFKTGKFGDGLSTDEKAEIASAVPTPRIVTAPKVEVDELYVMAKVKKLLSLLTAPQAQIVVAWIKAKYA